MDEYNKYFSIGDHIETVITEEQYQCLIADGKLWVTTCRMTGIEAAKVMIERLPAISR